jgi:carbonic anhydrase
VVRKNAELVANDLKVRSTIITDAVNNAELEIVPAYYNLDSGKVDIL